MSLKNPFLIIILLPYYLPTCKFWEPLDATWGRITNAISKYCPSIGSGNLVISKSFLRFYFQIEHRSILFIFLHLYWSNIHCKEQCKIRKFTLNKYAFVITRFLELFVKNKLQLTYGDDVVNTTKKKLVVI